MKTKDVRTLQAASHDYFNFMLEDTFNESVGNIGKFIYNKEDL